MIDNENKLNENCLISIYKKTSNGLIYLRSGTSLNCHLNNDSDYSYSYSIYESCSNQKIRLFISSKNNNIRDVFSKEFTSTIVRTIPNLINSELLTLLPEINHYYFDLEIQFDDHKNILLDRSGKICIYKNNVVNEELNIIETKVTKRHIQIRVAMKIDEVNKLESYSIFLTPKYLYFPFEQIYLDISHNDLKQNTLIINKKRSFLDMLADISTDEN